MKAVKLIIPILSIVVLVYLTNFETTTETASNEIVAEFENILFHEVNLKHQDLRFYSKTKAGNYFVNHEGLKGWLNNNKQELVFAMNGGMYQKDLSPVGLYIEHGEKISPIDKKEKGYGNFYMQPNGVFFITNDNVPNVVTTSSFSDEENIKYATQSGPMLVIDGDIHTRFHEKSTSLHIRNGVGILPNGNILFAMSKEKVNFYHLANFFKERECLNALYLDGFVSRTYLPSKEYYETGGKYGIIIAEVKEKN